MEVRPTSSIEIRPFERADRDQLTALVNRHAAAVVPGVSVSVNTVMSQLEREPDEFIVDPWVSERATLVAEQRRRVVAASHLQRYALDESVGESYRDAGLSRWFLCWPEAPYWPDSLEAGEALIAGCLEQFARWGVSRQYADGALPAPGVYGVPEHAVLGGEVVGYIEVATLEQPSRLPSHGGWADIGNLHVVEKHRRRGIATWLAGQPGEWLGLAGVERVLDYALPEQDDCVAFLATVGFRELTRTQRGWVRRAVGPGPLVPDDVSVLPGSA